MLFFCSCLSCNNHSDETLYNMSIAMSSNTILSDFIGEGTQIQLETTENSLVGDVDKICIDSNYIYIADKKNFKVLVFEKSGNYKSQIYAHGNGRNEYVSMSDMDVEGEQVYILSTPNKSIYVYNIEGEFQRKIKLNDWYHHLCLWNDFIVLHSSKSNQQYFNIIVIDSNGEVINKYLPFSKDNSYSFYLDPFNKVSGNELLLTFPYDRRVALLDDEGCNFKYKFDFETLIDFTDYEIDNLLYEDMRERTLNKNSLKGIDAITRLSEKEFLLIVTAFYERQGMRKALCKVNFENNSYSFYKLGDKIEKEFPYFHNPILLHNDSIYTVVPSNFRTNEIQDYKNPHIWIYPINR